VTSRRFFLKAVPTLLFLQSLQRFSSPAAAQWQDIPADGASALFRDLDAKAAGLDLPQSKAADFAPLSDEYDALLPRLVDLIEALEDQEKQAAPDKVGAFDDVLQKANELLGALTAAERSTSIEEDEKTAIVYNYEDLRDKYLALFKTCEIRPERAALVKWHAATLLKPANRARYEEVGTHLGIPWYFVGITHSLEAGFNFAGHLHNGDPLRERTFHVPAGRPIVWKPPTDWPSSAEDALTLKKYNNQPDWSLAHMLFRWEQYNGFGNRRRGVESPYLWSFSDKYIKGKYVKDGVWDPNAVSRQCGAAVLVKELIAEGAIPPPNEV
jgi:lysozyme family protein